jgi:hypothetical protein
MGAHPRTEEIRMALSPQVALQARAYIEQHAQQLYNDPQNEALWAQFLNQLHQIMAQGTARPKGGKKKAK